MISKNKKLNNRNMHGFCERLGIIIKPLSRSEFAQRLGLHSSTIWKWDDDHLPKGDVLLKINKMFNVNLNWLLSGDGDPHLCGEPKKDENVVWEIKPNVKYTLILRSE